MHNKVLTDFAIGCQATSVQFLAILSNVLCAGKISNARAWIQEGKKILLLVYCIFKHFYNADRVTLALRSTHLIYLHELVQ